MRVDAAPGAAVVMASMGDLAIAVAPHCNARGKLLSVYLPESVTPERREILRSFGATVTLTPVEEHYVGAVAAAQNHAQRHPEVSLLASDVLRRAEGMAETLGREWLAHVECDIDYSNNPTTELTLNFSYPFTGKISFN